jgi:hypothetical protein
MYAIQELAIRLRKRQVELLAAIRDEFPAESPMSNPASPRLLHLANAKQHVDACLADIAAELGWQDGFSTLLDREIESRSDAARIWGQ